MFMKVTRFDDNFFFFITNILKFYTKLKIFSHVCFSIGNWNICLKKSYRKIGRLSSSKHFSFHFITHLSLTQQTEVHISRTINKGSYANNKNLHIVSILNIFKIHTHTYKHTFYKLINRFCVFIVQQIYELLPKQVQSRPRQQTCIYFNFLFFFSIRSLWFFTRFSLLLLLFYSLLL